jgi:hypothetical protein
VQTIFIWDCYAISRLKIEVTHMKTNKQKHNWLIDAALFVGFLLSFWLEMTGVALHQWLGIAIGVGAGYPLVTHWAWVKAVPQRFFKQTSNQARLYYVIDAAVLIGLAVMIATGLVISTWLNLTLTNYAAWWTVHVIASLGTLAAVVVKNGLHGRWIVSTARRTIFTTSSVRPNPQAPAPATSAVGRREFLRLMGGVSAAAVIAAGSAVNALKQTSSAVAATAAPSVQTGTTNQVTAPTSTQAQSASSCSVSCTRGCSYPGQCRRYTDSDNHGRCDLGECVAASNTATSTTPSTPSGTTIQPTPTTSAQAPSAGSCTVRCSKGCSYPGRCRRYTDILPTGIKCVFDSDKIVA